MIVFLAKAQSNARFYYFFAAFSALCEKLFFCSMLHNFSHL